MIESIKEIARGLVYGSVLWAVLVIAAVIFAWLLQ